MGSWCNYIHWKIPHGPCNSCKWFVFGSWKPTSSFVFQENWCVFRFARPRFLARARGTWCFVIVCLVLQQPWHRPVMCNSLTSLSCDRSRCNLPSQTTLYYYSVMCTHQHTCIYNIIPVEHYASDCQFVWFYYQRSNYYIIIEVSS